MSKQLLRMTKKQLVSLLRHITDSYISEESGLWEDAEMCRLFNREVVE